MHSVGLREARQFMKIENTGLIHCYNNTPILGACLIKILQA